MGISSTDHLPIIAEICINVQQEKKQKQFKKGARRTLHNISGLNICWTRMGRSREDRRCQ
jgi:hypothetical protein